MSFPVANNEGQNEDEYDDMSIVSEDEEGINEKSLDNVGQIEPLPIVQLSFDNSRGGAWDDRELVNAYDSAMEEFHVGSANFSLICKAYERVDTSSWSRIMARQSDSGAGEGATSPRCNRSRYSVSLYLTGKFLLMGSLDGIPLPATT